LAQDHHFEVGDELARLNRPGNARRLAPSTAPAEDFTVIISRWHHSTADIVSISAQASIVISWL
jgi:hypothetical protein